MASTHDERLQHPTAQRRLRSRLWRLRHSVWMVPALATIGVFSWVSFGYVAARTRRLSWIAIAAGFFVVTGAMLLLPAGLDGGGAVVLLWGASILTAFVLNPAYLRWRSARDLPSAASASTLHGTPATGPQDRVGPRPGQATGPVFGQDGVWR